jgi:hypothetical protein
MMKFTTGNDNRNGSVSAKASKADAREDYYNIDPSNRYVKIKRTLSQRDGKGAGQIEVTLETSSEFIGFRKENYECTGLTFTSKGTIKLPQDAQATATGIVQESIWMGVRIAQAGKVHLTASVLSDMDIAEVRLQGPPPDPKSPSGPQNPLFDKRIYDDFDDTIDINTPGDYILKGAYNLSVKTPNASLGGRPISVEIQATLTPVS